MDQFSEGRVLKTFAASSAGYSLTRDTASSRARKAEICRRVGSGNQHSVLRGLRNSCLDKSKHLSSALLRIGEDNTGSSSRRSLTALNRSDSLVKPRKIRCSHSSSGSSDTSSVLDESEVAIAVPSPGKIPRGRYAGRSGDKVGEVAPDLVDDSSGAQNPRNNNTESDRPSLGSTLTSCGPTKGRILSQAKRACESRDILTNIRLNLATKNRSFNECSSNVNFDTRKGLSKKTLTYGEASTSNRGKKVGKQCFSGQTARGFGQGMETSESTRRRARCATIDRNPAVLSVRTQRQKGYDEPRRSAQSKSSVSQAMSLRTMHHSKVLDAMASSLRRSIEAFTGRLADQSCPGSSSEGSHSTLPSDILEMSFLGDLLNDNGYPEYRMEGIAEQVIALETNLFLNGTSLYDQHRDMRLDIDDMSYEELLALEERMGTVSTGLTEEELVKSLRVDVYRHLPLSGATSLQCGQKDDLKCSICQEDYVGGDEVGRLPCEHQYHVPCAREWLRIKNWCPICKGPAVVSSSLSPPPPML